MHLRDAPAQSNHQLDAAMGQHLFAFLRELFEKYGYGAVAVGLLLENAGVPLPGETILLFASFLAYSQHLLRLPYIILVGIAAAALGDNLGYLIGHHGGRRLLSRYHRALHLGPENLERAERLFARYGAVTVFFARFISGLRVVAGPLAGVLRMSWSRFLLFNLLGAVVWVIVVACVGYIFGSRFPAVARAFGRVDMFLLAALAAAIIVWLAWKRRRSR